MVPGSYTNIILFPRMIEFCKAPIYESEFSQLMVYHDIVRFDIPVHDSLRVTIIQCLQAIESPETYR